uniref:Transposable element Tcb1 transposase n=1 Tax=Anoplophora glabripennis TaxID=217634 RepID=V5G1E7_ANOGL
MFCSLMRLEYNYGSQMDEITSIEELENDITANLIQTVSFGGGGIMLWGGISWEGRTELVEVIGRMTSDWYIENILQDHVLPYMGHIGYDRFVFMHDNARPHAAGIVTNYLDTVQIQKLDWPPYSPDLNPIEHLWDQLKRRIRQRNPVPNTLEELRLAAQYEWNAIPQDFIQTLISSMLRRMQAVIRARY